MDNRKILIAVFFSILMIGSALAVVGANSNNVPSSMESNHAQVNKNAPLLVQAGQQAASSSAWKLPTNAMHEPGYTNGTFKIGQVGNIGSLNPFDEATYCDAYIDCSIWGMDALYDTTPNGTNMPWMSYGVANITHVGSGNQTYNILTNSEQNYSYIYTLNLRPYIRWNDWSPQNNSQTYTFSNTIQFCNGTSLITHTYKSYKPTVMKKYYLQSADVVLSYRIKAFLGDFPSVVNVVPNGNLSVKFYITTPSLILYSDIFACDILPYNVWVHHDYTETGAGLFNYTNISNSKQVKAFDEHASDGYCSWNMGWNPETGLAPGVVGAGPFMLSNSFGMPQGKVITGQYEKMYINPYFFTQYTNASSHIRQFTPKIYEMYMPLYTSISSEIAAFSDGKIDTTSLAPPADFLPQLESTPHSFIYKKLSSERGYMLMNLKETPLNITAFRQALSYAVPYPYLDQVIADGFAVPNSSPINPGNALYYNASGPQYTFDMAKAKSLIAGIPGMSYSGSKLMYDGKQVCIKLQITTGSEDPTGVASAEKTFTYWNSLGIATKLKEEAFTTLTSNEDTTILTHHKSEDFQMVSEGISTTTSGDPLTGCQDFLSPTLGIPAKEYLGPFTPMKVNGKMLNGTEVQALFCKLLKVGIATDSFSVAAKITKRLQSLIVEQDASIATGYGIDLIPLSKDFTNYSLTNADATYAYWFWNLPLISLSSHVAPPVVHKYKLTQTVSYDTGSAYNASSYGNVTFTVLNGTTPVDGAILDVGTDSIYGGVTNITSDTLTTNAQGKAVWEFKVASYLSEQLIGCNATSEKTYSVHNESLEIIAVIHQPHAVATASSTVKVPMDIVNGPIMTASYTLSNIVDSANKTVKSFDINVHTEYNGSSYAGANVTINDSNFHGLKLAKGTSTSEKTNSKGIATFGFIVTNYTLAKSMIYGNSNRLSMLFTIYSNNTKINNDTISAHISFPAAVSPVGLSTVEIGVIGGVSAVVVIGGASAFVIRKRKKVTK